MDASCIDKSGIDPIVYNGTMETSVQYNTNDMMVHVSKTIFYLCHIKLRMIFHHK